MVRAVLALIVPPGYAILDCLVTDAGQSQLGVYRDDNKNTNALKRSGGL